MVAHRQNNRKEQKNDSHNQAGAAADQAAVWYLNPVAYYCFLTMKMVHRQQGILFFRGGQIRGGLLNDSRRTKL